MEVDNSNFEDSEFEEELEGVEEHVALLEDELVIRLALHLRCASHTLNLLATTDAKRAIVDNVTIDEIHENAMKQCKELWKCLNSPKKREAITQYLGVSLKRPVETRWNSMYDAVEQICSIKRQLMSYEAQDILQMPSRWDDEHFEYLEEYLKWSKPLAAAIDKLQGEKGCFYGCTLPTLIGLRRKWESMVENDTSIVISKDLIKDMITALETRFSDYFNIVGDVGKFAATAALLHPKFKLSWAPCLNSEAQNAVQNLTRNLMPHYENERPAIDEDDEVDDFYDFGAGSTNFLSNSSLIPQQAGENELMRFLQHPNKSMDILNEFPQVKKLFLKYNTPLPSSASVERLFSYATLLNLPKFNRLTDAHFEKRIICKANVCKKYL